MTIALTEITEGKLNGKGAFDVLMNVARLHLDEEFRKNRFTTDQYAEIYLGTMTQVLQQSMQFALTKLRTEQEVALIAAQIEQTRAQTDLLFQQKVNLITENANIQLQGDKLIAEKLLLEKELLKVQEDILLAKQQNINLGLDAINIPKQGAMLDAQRAKVNADAAVSGQQLVNLQTENLQKIALTDQIKKQILKHDKEIEVLDHKANSEEAMIKDTVNGAAVAGVVGRQKALYQAQADGFQRDAEQKAAKMFFDVWSVQRTTDEGISPAGAGLADAEIAKVAAKLRLGIGAV